MNTMSHMLVAKCKYMYQRSQVREQSNNANSWSVAKSTAIQFYLFPLSKYPGALPYALGNVNETACAAPLTRTIINKYDDDDDVNMEPLHTATEA